jgi:hypothetical protein
MKEGPPAACAVSTAPVRRPGHVRDVVFLGSLSAFAPLSIDMYLPALPSMARDLHTSAAAAQLSDSVRDRRHRRATGSAWPVPATSCPWPSSSAS